MLKASQNRTKRAPLTEASMSSTPARCIGWFATTPTGRPARRMNPTSRLRREGGVDLEELPFVGDPPDELPHVVGLVRLLRNEGVQVARVARRLARLAGRRVVQVVRRQIGQQLADRREHRRVVPAHEVRDPRHGRVRPRAAELLLGHLFVGDRLDDVGTGHEEVGGLLGHEDEVGDRRRVDGAAGAGPEDRRDLRHDAGRPRVAQEDLRVARPARRRLPGCARPPSRSGR